MLHNTSLPNTKRPLCCRVCVIDPALYIPILLAHHIINTGIMHFAFVFYLNDPNTPFNVWLNLLIRSIWFDINLIDFGFNVQLNINTTVTARTDTRTHILCMLAGTCRCHVTRLRHSSFSNRSGQFLIMLQPNDKLLNLKHE